MQPSTEHCTYTIHIAKLNPGVLCHERVEVAQTKATYCQSEGFQTCFFPHAIRNYFQKAFVNNKSSDNQRIIE